MSFGGGSAVSVAGTLSGAAIAIGVPAVILAFGANLGATIQTALVVAALIVGGGVSLVSAFFGLVMPRRIPGAWTRPGHWKGWADKGREWRRFRDEVEAAREKRGRGRRDEEA
jgi:hypothetical protein